MAGPEQKADRQEPGREDRRVPERPRFQPVIEEGRHRMDAHGPGDGDQDEGDHEFLVRFFSIVELHEHVDGNEYVEDQVPVKDEHVPGEEGPGETEPSDIRDEVPEPVRPAQVDEDEQEGHDNGRCRPQLSKDHDLLDRLEVVHVCGYDEEDGRCRHPDKVGEIGDIHAPRHLVAHVRHDQPLIESDAGSR